MNKQMLKGNWNQFKGQVKRQWGRLTDDDLTKVEGDFDRLVGVIQERYGLARQQARQELESFLDLFESETEPQR